MEWQEIQDNAVQRRSVPAEPTIVVAQEPSTQPSQPRARKPPLSLFSLLILPSWDFRRVFLILSTLAFLQGI